MDREFTAEDDEPIPYVLTEQAEDLLRERMPAA